MAQGEGVPKSLEEGEIKVPQNEEDLSQGEVIQVRVAGEAVDAGKEILRAGSSRSGRYPRNTFHH
jgi:hypothetical protein